MNDSLNNSLENTVSGLLAYATAPNIAIPPAFGLWMRALPVGTPIPSELDGLRLQQVLREEWAD